MPNNLIDLTGQRFGRLLVKELSQKRNKQTYWLCRCDCGREKITRGMQLRDGSCKSCGCYVKEMTGNRFRTHGKTKTLEYKLLIRARRRAKRFNENFNINLSDIYIPTHCPILGIPILRSNNGKCSNNSPSLDRIDNSLGYIKGNVKVISMRANRLKQDSSLLELEKIVNYIKENKPLI